MALILSGTNGLSDVDGSAATPAIRGADANTGIFFPGADRIGFAEGGVQVGEFDASGNFRFNSGYGSAAVAYGCRAWVDFDGTGTPAISASGNVTSITDNGVGNYTVNFTTAMPDASYAYIGLARSRYNATTGQTPVVSSWLSDTKTTSAVQVRSFEANNIAFDSSEVNISVFR